MKVLALRFCSVSDQASAMIRFFDALGLQKQDLGEHAEAARMLNGAMYPAGDSWIELWQHSAQLPAGMMLQLEVDDADAFAAHARANGLMPDGPVDDHGERVYMLTAPDGMTVSIQSAHLAEVCAV